MVNNEQFSPDLFGRLGERKRIFQSIEITQFDSNEFMLNRNLARSITGEISRLKKEEERNIKIEMCGRLKKIIDNGDYGILIAKRDSEELLKCRMCGEMRFCLHYDYYSSYSDLYCNICGKCAKREGYKEMDEDEE